MSKPNHNWLDDVPLSDDVWLEMLVDGELTSRQRAAFVAHIKETNDWQRVATGFLDNQVFAAAVPFEVESPQVVSQPVRVSERAWHGSLVVAAACLVCGLFFGSMFSRGAATAIGTVVESEGSGETPRETEEVAIVSKSLPALYQVRDTPDEAVYYVDCNVPQFLLESLVLAGHDVKLEQDFLGYTESPDSPAAVPINVLRIEKYGRLMASAEPLAADINQP